MCVGNVCRREPTSVLARVLTCVSRYVVVCMYRTMAYIFVAYIVMAYIAMAYIAMACIAMAYRVMACRVLVYVVMVYVVMVYVVMIYIRVAYVVMAYTVIAYIVMVYIVMVDTRPSEREQLAPMVLPTCQDPVRGHARMLTCVLTRALPCATE